MDTMTREQLENQLDIMQHQRNELVTRQNQAVADLNANGGAIQMCEYLLTQMNNQNGVGADLPTPDEIAEEKEEV